MALWALSACSDIDSEMPDSAFAMEAWIDSDGYPVVLLSRSAHPSQSPIPIADVMVKWAKVTISDGTETWVMTGGIDDTFLPPYSYRSYAVQGKVGATYTVTAEYMGTYAQASSTILAPPEIKDVTFRKMDNGFYTGTLTFEAPAKADTCMYVVQVRVLGKNSRYYPSLMGTTTSSMPRQICEVPLSIGKYLGQMSYNPDFEEGDKVDIILSRVEPTVYRFWKAYEEQVYFGNNIFLSTPVDVVGNVVGGYGVFSARGSARWQAVVGF